MITIDKEFQYLIPKLTDEEFLGLENSIINEGCRDAVIVWNNIIIDGHNRYNICTKHNIQFNTYEMDFDNRNDVIVWIINNQLSRRNVTEEQKSYLRGKRYENEKLRHGKVIESQNLGLKTHVKLADEFNVSKNTILNDAEFSKGIDNIAKVQPELKATILSGTSELTKQDIQSISKVQSIAEKEIKTNNILVNEKEIKALIELKANELTKEKLRKIENEKQKKKDERRELVNNKIDILKTKEIQEPTGLYDVIVIDPPWQMEKIEREVAPNQVGFDYPTMTIEEIKAFKLPAEKDCHLFLWTTQKYLPISFDVLKSWNAKYVCSFVWHKNGGFQPFGLPMYNCEFVLYARIGTPIFIDFKDFKLCFDAERTGHSKKPDYFYNLVKRVTAGKRIDIFNRREIDGFDTWGNESC
jgi:N6-adenosine-specific RNA methylase IME4